MTDTVHLHCDDDTLATIGQLGIIGGDGKRRGPLGLTLDALRHIRRYFTAVGRDPTDIELEMIAQTWSEHCAHLTMRAPIDEITDGLFNHYIRAATHTVRQRRGTSDICISVFDDNAGAIVFDDDWLLCDKVETHNSPSALDPYHGAMTGIAGVNRDCLGFGLGARPIANRYGFVLPPPQLDAQYHRDAAGQVPLADAATMYNGIVSGVGAVGNCCGVPTLSGFVHFDRRFAATPLVFCGTVGLLPRTLGDGRPAHDKSVVAGDAIVVLGAATGADGLHGATMSSLAIDAATPADAVPRCDPFMQTQLTDCVLAARDAGLLRSITDNGAGGLACSVSELSRGCGGFVAHIEAIPVRDGRLPPWAVWLAETQDRMTVAVAPDNLDALLTHCAEYDVPAACIGHFSDDGFARVCHHGQAIVTIALDWLFAPPLPQLHSQSPDGCFSAIPRAVAPAPAALPSVFAQLRKRSRAAVYRQFDHEVQGNVVCGPSCGPTGIDSHAQVIRPVRSSDRAVALAHALAVCDDNEDPYPGVIRAVVTAVARIIACGGSLDHLSLLDNICWSSPDDPARLWQLRRTMQGCHDAAVAMNVPFISGKDSMCNNFHGRRNGTPVALAAPPTVLISSLGVIASVDRVSSADGKHGGDQLFALPLLLGHDVDTAAIACQLLQQLQPLCAAIHISDDDGLFVAAVEMAVAGGLGIAFTDDDMSSYSNSTQRYAIISLPAKQANAAVALAPSLLALGTLTNDGIIRMPTRGECRVADIVSALHRPLVP